VVYTELCVPASSKGGEAAWERTSDYDDFGFFAINAKLNAAVFGPAPAFFTATVLHVMVTHRLRVHQTTDLFLALVGMPYSYRRAATQTYDSLKVEALAHLAKASKALSEMEGFVRQSDSPEAQKRTSYLLAVDVQKVMRRLQNFKPDSAEH